MDLRSLQEESFSSTRVGISDHEEKISRGVILIAAEGRGLCFLRVTDLARRGGERRRFTDLFSTSKGTSYVHFF